MAKATRRLLAETILIAIATLGLILLDIVARWTNYTRATLVALGAYGRTSRTCPCRALFGMASSVVVIVSVRTHFWTCRTSPSGAAFGMTSAIVVIVIIIIVVVIVVTTPTWLQVLIMVAHAAAFLEMHAVVRAAVSRFTVMPASAAIRHINLRTAKVVVVVLVMAANREEPR